MAMTTELLAMDGWCKIPPKTRGGKQILPPGFRAEREYRILAGFYPNGCQDLHFHVINEVGKIVPLPADDVMMVHYTEEAHQWEWTFETEIVDWVVALDARKRGHLYVVACYTLEGVLIHPDIVSWSSDLSVVTVTWPTATKGKLILR